LAEVANPDTIDENACGQRVVRAGDGAGEFEPAASIVERLTARAGENLGELAGHRGPARIRVAAQEDDRFHRPRRIVEDVGPRGRRRTRGLEPFDLLAN